MDHEQPNENEQAQTQQPSYGQYPPPAFPTGQYAAGHYAGNQPADAPYPGSQFSGNQYPGSQQPSDQYTGGVYPASPYTGGQFGNDQYTGYAPSSAYQDAYYPTPYPTAQYPSAQQTAQYQAAQPAGYPPMYPAPERPTRKRGSAAMVTAVAIVAGALVGAGGVAAFQAIDHSNSSSSGSPIGQLPNSTSSGQNGAGQNGGGSSQNGSGQSGSGQNGTSTSSANKATAAQQVGVVDIDTVVNYNQGEAAGTGMIIGSDGYILTNNHVIDESTQIKVTVVSTGATYTAKVVGTDPSDDVAVIKVDGVSNLAVAKLGNSSSVKVGDSVTGVGNAGGVGGTPSAAKGTVTALNQSITASDSDGSNAEQLHGLIQTNAQIQAGDSGGPLYNASGSIIGIDTAAETSRSSGTTVAGYSIPINSALGIAKRIISGEDSSTIHQGYPAFLGVGLASTSSTALGSVVSSGPAASAGVVAGDTITAVNGTAVSTAANLKAALAKYKPGDRVKITWTTAAGTSQSATVTLAKGPAD